MHILRVMAICLAAVLWSAESIAGQWSSGGYSFSDELGGFVILGVSGSGTNDDPIVVVQNMHQAAPVTMVIRPQLTTDSYGNLKRQSFIQFSLVVAVTNGSKRNWAGFDLELQEIPGQPSVYFDGLSFDQVRTFSERVFLSDKFSVFSDLTEPYDRIRFEDGYVIPNETVRLKVFITDVTPPETFYLVQDPQILMAQRNAPAWRRFAKIVPELNFLP
jgi:hypothetical protein